MSVNETEVQDVELVEFDSTQVDGLTDDEQFDHDYACGDGDWSGELDDDDSSELNFDIGHNRFGE